MNYIIIDFEASCWKFPKPPEEQEIIEIGALRLDRFGLVIDKFESFVKPIIHPVLSHFCIQLTGILQKDIENASSFPTVYNKLLDWLERYPDFRLASWGAFDENLLRNNCELHNLDIFWTYEFINIKKQYSFIHNLSKPIGLKKAVELEKFEFEGNHHRAFDDAYNTAKIFGKYLDEWIIH
jgi:inhibitor of KinA sporulation pathway (predicted exonuclease)